MSFTPTTIGQQIAEDIVNDAKTLFENNSGETRRDRAIDVAALGNGSTINLISSEADLPTPVNGFINLEQDKSYLFIEPFVITNRILFPAGYVGSVKTSFLTTGNVTYTGTGSLFNTLNIDGVIDSITNAGSGAITVTTNTAHGLLDGQFVNITGTTSYNQSRLVISNASGSVYDVQISFVADEVGTFNTGFDTINLANGDYFNLIFSADLLNLTSSGSPTSILIVDGITTFGFLSPGIVKNATSVLIKESLLGFFSVGMTFEDCLTVNIATTVVASISTISGARGLILQGALTTNVILNIVQFSMTESTQHPIRVDPTIATLASIVIQNSPDNLVATDYYDTDSGGLDQTDPRVTALNNGTRKNSMTLAEARTFGILEVDGSGGVGVDVPIVDITPVPGDWIQDSSTEEFTVDTTTGLTTYIGLKPISVKIEYSLSATQTSGGLNQELEFDLHITGVAQPKTLRTLTTAGVGTFLAISYDGGNFDINPGDTFQIFKNNLTNTLNTDVQDVTLLITRN